MISQNKIDFLHDLTFERSFLPLYEASFSAKAASVAIRDFVPDGVLKEFYKNSNI